jgi:predicted metal-binding protein
MSAASGRLEMWICRGCCCGTERKHPDVDHVAQVDALAAAVDTRGGMARLRTTDCLDACDRSNVVVLRQHGQTVWLGEILEDRDTATLCRWLRSGEPLAALPRALSSLAFAPEDAARLPDCE